MTPTDAADAVRPAALTFDAHGTLIAPQPSVGAVYAEIAARHGIERTAAELDAAFPAAFAAARSAWRVPYGADDEDAVRFWARVMDGAFGHGLPTELVWDAYDAFAEKSRWRVLPGAREALALAREAALPLAVVSNFDRRLVGLLEAHGLTPFTAVVTSTAVGRAKPDPAPLLEACRRMGVPPARVLHIGDSEREDGAMCAAAGARWLRADPVAGVPVEALRALLAAA